jgi:uncharacterized repeat protein (TIGR01451 family)
VTSNIVTFKADRKIDLTVAEAGGAYTLSYPGATLQTLKYTVTNLSNDTIDIRLVFQNEATGTAGPFGGSDAFGATANAVWVDDGDGVFEPGTDDPGVSFLDNVAEDETRTVWVSGTIPLAQANGDLAVGTLLGFANSDGSGGAANDYTESATEAAATVETVLADGQGSNDTPRDGRYSARDGWQVQTATIAVTKTTAVITDPFNCTTPGDASSCTGTPKAIPGAVIEHCVVIGNTGATAADTVAMTDSLAGQPVTFVSGSIVAGGAVDCTGGTAEDDDATGADDTLGAAQNTGDLTGTTVTTRVFTLPAGASTSSRFRVTIN